MELMKDKEKLKKERREQKKLREKIVCGGNTMDSYGENFTCIPYNEINNEKASVRSNVETGCDSKSSDKSNKNELKEASSDLRKKD